MSLKLKILTRSIVLIILVGIVFITFNHKTKDDFNLIFILIDALRPDHLGCYGYYRDTSPNIDEFARKSIIFTDALAQSALTELSLKSIFLSQYVHSHNNEKIKRNSIASILRKNGFIATAFTGGGHTNRAFGFGEDFNLYEDSHLHRSLKDINPMVIRWLKNNYNKRFFLFVHTYDVHCPYNPPELYRSMFTDKDFKPQFEIEGKCGNPYFNSLSLKTDDFKYLNALYDGGIRYADSMLREIFDQIEFLNLSDNTIIIIASDHGESLGERSYVGHGGIYDVQLKMTFIIKIPGFGPKVISEPVQSIDIAPTILGLLNIKPLSTMKGVSLVPIIKGELSFNNSRLRLSQSLSSYAIRADSRWKLIFNHENNSYSFYDLDNDFEEINDLSEKYRDIADDLRFKLLKIISGRSRLKINSDIYDEDLREHLRSLGYL